MGIFYPGSSQEAKDYMKIALELMVYPLSTRKLKELNQRYENILVIEEMDLLPPRDTRFYQSTLSSWWYGYIHKGIIKYIGIENVIEVDQFDYKYTREVIVGETKKEGISVIIAGVEGQVLVLATKIISEAAFRARLDVKTNDVVGLSQRGAMVWGSIKIGEKVYSPNILMAGNVKAANTVLIGILSR